MGKTYLTLLRLLGEMDKSSKAGLRNGELRARQWEVEEIPRGVGLRFASNHVSQQAHMTIQIVAPAPTFKSPTMPGHLNGYKASPSLPALNITNTFKRTMSPRIPARAPLPSFEPPNGHSSSSTSTSVTDSASSAALAAFLEAKKGQQMTADDFRVIETLTANMKSESVVGSPRRTDQTGGWSAGVFSETPRAIRPLRHSNGFGSTHETPSRITNVFGTPGAPFSVGTKTPIGSTFAERRITYLGPGMSPRRMFPKNKSGLKPLFNLDFSIDESASKKRKTDENHAGINEETIGNHQLLLHGLNNSVSMPDLTTSVDKKSPLTDAESKGSVTPGPAFHSSHDIIAPRPSAVAIGKKRAADIMRELIDEELGQVEEHKQHDQLVINPYDTESSPSSLAPTPSTPRSPMRSTTPRKSVLRSSLRGNDTPKRGAAAKLESHRSGRKLTTLEILQGKRPVSGSESRAVSGSDGLQWTETSVSTSTSKDTITPSKSGRTETPGREIDEMEIDAYFDETPSRSPARPQRSLEPSRSPSHAPPATKTASGSVSAPVSPPRSRRIPSPEPFAPFSVPTLVTHTEPIPTFKATSSFSQTFASPSQDLALASSKKTVPPRFKPSPLSSVVPIEIDESDLQSTSLAPRGTSKYTKVDAIFFSARDSALKVDKLALPFFTFTLPSAIKSPAEAVRIEALKAPLQEFSFVLPSLNGTAVRTPPTSSSEGLTWTCGLCMLKNPASATTKCQICEAPKPQLDTSAKTKASVSVSMPKKAGPSGEGEWTCGLCMLKNPGSAREKCLICDEKRA